jgi:excisionase family DNA binding protein
MGSLDGILRRRGIEIDMEALASVVEHAIEEAGGIPPYPNPAKLLSADQLKLLAGGGFEIQETELGVEDPILLGAIEYAVLRLTALTTKEAAERLGVNDSRVRQRLGNRELYGIKAGDEWRLPLFQFVHDGLVPNIDKVLPRLDASLSPVSVFRWFVTENPDLFVPEGKRLSPLQWLVSGHDPDVPAELAHWL